MADGKIAIDTDISVKKSEQQLKELASVAKSAGDKIGQDLSASAKKFSNEWNIAKAGYDKNVGEMERLSRDLADSMGALDVSRSLGDVEGIGKITQEIEKIKSSMEPLPDRIDKFAIGMEIAGNKASNVTRGINDSATETDTLNRKVAKTSVELKKAGNATSGLSGGIQKGVKSLAKYALALFGIRAVYSTLRKLSQQWLDSDDAGAQQIKANLEAISSALSNALAPIITYIANMFVTAVAYANALLKAFFGIDLLSKKTAKNTNKVAGGTAKARKEAEKFTSAFDKADIATSKIADNMDSGGGGGMDMAVPAVIPEPDISKLLKEFDKAKKVFEDIWNSPKVQSAMNSIVRIAKVSFDSIASMAGNIWDNFALTFEAMLPNLQRSFTAMTDFFVMFLSDMADATETWFPLITEGFNKLVDNIFDTFRPFAVFLTELWADLWEMIRDLWEIHGAPLLDKIGQWVVNVLEIWDLLWDLIDTIISPILDVLEDVWNSTLKDLLFEVADFILELIGYALDIYNEFIAPIVKFLLTVLQPIFAVVFGTIGGIVAGVFNGIFAVISSVIGSIRGVLNGLIKFISGVFKGNWSQAWQGIVDIFGSIFEGIGNLMKIPINFIIDGLNGFIRGLNKIKIPNWVPGVGGKGINIGSIPRLAKGGVLNQPTLNLAGEYAGAKHNPEIVTPQNIMSETMEDVLGRVGGYGGGSQTINLVVSGSVLAKVVEEEKEKGKLLMNGGMAHGFG